MKFEKTKVVVEIYGEVVELTSPTVSMITKIQSVREENPDKILEALQEMLLSCGLKKDTLDSMEADHMNQLIEHLVAKKK